MCCRLFLQKSLYSLLLCGFLCPVTVQTLPAPDLTQHDRTFYKFVTRPDIDAPVFKVVVLDEDAIAPGYWFVAFYEDVHQIMPSWQWIGPHIYDGKGELVWSGAPMFEYWNIYDFDTRTVHGEQMLTLWDREHKRAISSTTLTASTRPCHFPMETCMGLM
jgi:hypothetical protein